MHEMSLAMSLIEELRRQVKPYGRGTRVTRVVMDIGRMHAVMPDAMRFAFEAASRGTVAEGAELEINELDVVGHCPACSEDRRLERVQFLCPQCGYPVTVTQGEELLLRSIELEEPPEEDGHDGPNRQPGGTHR